MVTRSCLLVAMLCGLFVVTPQVQAQESELVSKLPGTWVGDGEKTRKMLKEMGTDADEIDEMIEEIGNVKLTIDKEGKFTVQMEAAPEPLSGTWTKKSEDAEKKTLVMTLTIKFGDQEQPMDFTFTIMDDNTVKLMPEGEKPAIFVREVK